MNNLNKQDSRIHIKEEQITTSNIEDNEIIDIKVTGMPYYQEFIQNPNWENLQATIDWLSPNEYYATVSENSLVRGWYFSIEYLKKDRGAHTKELANIKSVITELNKKLCIPILDFYHKKQEGLHRMMVIGDMYGWDFKVPVLVIRQLSNNNVNGYLAQGKDKD